MLIPSTNGVAEVVLGLINNLKRSGDGPSAQDNGGSFLLHRMAPRPDGLFAEAYLHEIYAPLSDEGVGKLQSLIPMQLPSPLLDFYRSANGFSIFFDSLSIHGLKSERSKNQRSPVSLEFGNTIDLPQPGRRAVSPEARQIRFGFYSYDPGFSVVMHELDDPRVYLVPRREIGPVLHQWSSFNSFLSEEVSRLEAAFSSRGGRIDPFNVLPPPVKS